jgi:hypothetical protein
MRLLAIAIFLLILWLVLRFAVAMTGAFLHLIWVVAVVVFILWLIGLMRAPR